MATPADALRQVLATLDRMEIAYSIGGSLASSEHGLPRTTMDVDLVVDLKPDQIDEFAALLQNSFYADPDLIRESFSHHRAANVIHYETGYKFDLFPLGNDEYSRTDFQRRSYREIQAIRRGDEPSEHQWNDLRGLIRVNYAKLDLAYLREWAPNLRVADLLEKLLGERTSQNKEY